LALLSTLMSMGVVRPTEMTANEYPNAIIGSSPKFKRKRSVESCAACVADAVEHKSRLPFYLGLPVGMMINTTAKIKYHTA
jgi:hypothetical protein